MSKINLEFRLSLLFATMEARKASMRLENEDRKLSRCRYWWQDEPQKERKHDDSNP